MENVYVLYVQYFDYETQIEFIAASLTKELLYGMVYDWLRESNDDMPDDDAEVEKWFEEKEDNEDIGGWWNDRKTNFHYYNVCDGIYDFYIREVDLLK
jgi:hypothetical protein